MPPAPLASSATGHRLLAALAQQQKRRCRMAQEPLGEVTELVKRWDKVLKARQLGENDPPEYRPEEHGRAMAAAVEQSGGRCPTRTR